VLVDPDADKGSLGSPLSLRNPVRTSAVSCGFAVGERHEMTCQPARGFAIQEQCWADDGAAGHFRRKQIAVLK